MPKYSSEKREYTVGDYWLGQRSGSPAWYRMWYDERSRRTKRASLNTTDFEEAKELLNDWFFANRNPQNESSQEAMLAEILARYYDQHARNIPSSTQARVAIKYWLDFYKDEALSYLSPIQNQEAFHAWLADKQIKPTTVSRIISVGRAAINRAWKRGEIAQAPFIHEVDRRLLDNKPPRGRPMEIEEIGLLFESTPNPAMKRFIILMIATCARPDAIYDLHVQQCDIPSRIIHLNPADRMQTKKYRPSVKIPHAILPFLESWQESNCYLMSGQEVAFKNVRTAWRNARTQASLDGEVQPYSLRHTMARWLRKQSVSAWEVSAQLGHKRRDMAITEVYAPHDPAYLQESCDAIDYFFAELRAKCAPVDTMLNC